MDEIQGTTVKGSIPGRAARGVALVQGKLGYAISVNGNNEAIKFGKHPSKCFYNPDACTAGSTFSYWLKKWSVSSSGLIMDSGGFYSSARGYTHQLTASGRIIVYVKSSSSYYQLGAPISDPEKWSFIVQSWFPFSGITLYVNGCIVSTNTRRWVRSHGITWSANFVIGKKSIHMEIDNFLAWEFELTEDEAWRLYMQAGQV